MLQKDTKGLAKGLMSLKKADVKMDKEMDSCKEMKKKNRKK